MENFRITEVCIHASTFTISIHAAFDIFNRLSTVTFTRRNRDNAVIFNRIIMIRNQRNNVTFNRSSAFHALKGKDIRAIGFRIKILGAIENRKGKILDLLAFVIDIRHLSNDSSNINLYIDKPVFRNSFIKFNCKRSRIVRIVFFKNLLSRVSLIIHKTLFNEVT